MAPEIELSIIRGKTWEQAFLYGDDELVYKPITSMPSRAPVRIGCPGHGVPNGWPVTVSGVKAPAELNTAEGEDPRFAKVIDADTIEFNALNGSDWKAYGTGGTLIFNEPVDLTGWSARAVVRDKIGGALLFSWHSDPAETPDGLILVDIAASAFVLQIDAATAAALAFNRGVWELEAVDGAGKVYQIVSPSAVTVIGEVVT